MTKAYERITEDPRFDGKCRESHLARYHIAASVIKDNYRVVDAGCGTGYGRRIIENAASGVSWTGIDKSPEPGFADCVIPHDLEKPLDIYNMPMRFDFHVFIGLEIIEHLESITEFVKLAAQAREAIIVSTPIIPNSNPYHKQQFTREQIIRIFEREKTPYYVRWVLKHYFEQNNTYGIFIFKPDIDD